MNLPKLLSTTSFVLKRNSPTILMILGIGGVITSAVMACKATLKVEEVLDKSKRDIDKIKASKDALLEYPDYKKDLTLVYGRTTLEFLKMYGPAILLCTASVSALLGSHGIMRKRNLALTAAVKTVEKAFKSYRKRVIDELGAEKDREFKHGIKTEEIIIKENGKKVKKKVEVVTDPSCYARFFDETCSQWQKTPEYNFVFLKAQQNYLNDLLTSRGHVFLNEVYENLGLQHSQAGALVGWIKDGDGDGFIDFGIFNGDNEAKVSFVNGYERSILLDFNVDGVIYDQI
jgi:hypothetical protein